MSKAKNKKIASKILKILWFIFGGLILLWTIMWSVKMDSVNDLGVIIVAVMFAIGIYAFIAYAGITLLFILIRWIVKKAKHRKKR